MKEIYNFTQDDLTTEDVLVLDCHREIYVWIGCHSNVGSKQQALNLGLVKFSLPLFNIIFPILKIIILVAYINDAQIKYVFSKPASISFQAL